MSNMSYCRFHNTDIDLNDCLWALEDNDELSEMEYEACVHMFNRFVNFLVDNGIIDEDGDLEDRLEDFFKSLNRRKANNVKESDTEMAV